MRLKTFDIKSVEEDAGGGITAYASTFDRVPDAYGDVVAKGAFKDTLRAWEDSGRPIPLLFGHNMEDPDYNIGRVTSAEEDGRGLRVTAVFDPDNPKGQYVRKLVNEGRVAKLSFAYDVEDEGTVTLEDGTKANELRKLDLYEVSLVTVPANSHAEVLESKGLAKYGRAISKASGAAIGHALEEIQAAAASLARAADALRELVGDDGPQNEPDDTGGRGDDADEGAGEEDPGRDNSQAKSRELIDKLNHALED